MHRDTDMCRAQFHDTPGHVFQNYQSQIRLSVKMKFLVGLAHKITEAIGTTNMPQVANNSVAGRQGRHGRRDAVGHGSVRLASGEWYVPNRHFMYAAQVLTQDLYPSLQTIRDLAGGALIMLPSSFGDWSAISNSRRSSTRRNDQPR